MFILDIYEVFVGYLIVFIILLCYKVFLVILLLLFDCLVEIIFIFFFQIMIVSCLFVIYDWDSDNIQEFDLIFLEVDKLYYIEVYYNDFGGGYNVKIRVCLDKIEYINSKVGVVCDE